jgi:hypothetical protein
MSFSVTLRRLTTLLTIMTTFKILSSLTSLLALSLTAAHAAETVWDEPFDGRALNANLHEHVRGTDAFVVQVDGKLLLDTNMIVGSAQAAVNTRTDHTGKFNGVREELLYNYHAHSVEVRFEIASIKGTNGSGRNVFYCSIGEDAEGNYMPQNKVLDNGIGISLEQWGEPSAWRLTYGAFRNGEGPVEVVAVLSERPSAITCTISGDSIEIELEGASISQVGNAGGAYSGGAEATVTIEDLSDVISEYTLAFGAYNLGTVASGTVVTLDRFSVKVGK